MGKKGLSVKKIAKASKLTRLELNFINYIAETAWTHGHRPLVYLALCSAILSNVIRDSKGAISRRVVIGLVDKGIEK